MKTKTNKKTVKTAVKPFTPKADTPHLERGKEFLSLRKQGMSVDQIVAMYKKLGIKKLAAPTIYNAIKLVKAPQFVKDAVANGSIPASATVELLKPLRATSGANKGRKVKESPEDFEKRVQAKLDELLGEREGRRELLEKGGFTAEGNVKLTKTRTLAIVAKNLRSIKGSLKNPRAAAIIEFEKALSSGASVDELVAMASKRG